MTVHITSPETRETLTSRRWGDVAASLSRGLAEYLEGLAVIDEHGRTLALANVLHEHSDRTIPRPASVTPDDPTWPPYPRAVVVQVGECSLSDDQGSGRFVAALDAPAVRLREVGVMTVRLEVYISCLGAPQRRAVTAAVDAAMSPVDWSTGVRLALEHYHGVHASYSLVSTEVADTDESARRGERVVTVRVDAGCSRVQLMGAPAGMLRIEPDVT